MAAWQCWDGMQGCMVLMWMHVPSETKGGAWSALSALVCSPSAGYCTALLYHEPPRCEVEPGQLWRPKNVLLVRR